MVLTDPFPIPFSIAISMVGRLYCLAILAVMIGMIPDLPLEDVYAVGNAAGDGARIALLNVEKRREAGEVAHQEPPVGDASPAGLAPPVAVADGAVDSRSRTGSPSASICAARIASRWAGSPVHSDTVPSSPRATWS